MRLDKYLKVSRLIKRRTLAKEVCDQEKVIINDRPAKASTDVKPGDILTIKFGAKQIKVRVVDTPASIRADQARETYLIIEESL